MALNEKLTDQGVTANISDDDVSHMVDVSDVSSDPSGTSKQLKWSLIKSTLKTHFDTIYAQLSDFLSLSSRVDNLEENQVTGVEVYEEFADLPAPGTLLRSYKVTNDPTSSLNGYYHWTGSVYQKDASLAIGEVAEGDVDAVEGGKIYDAISNIEVGFIQPFAGSLVIDTTTQKISTTGQLFVVQNGSFYDVIPAQPETSFVNASITGLNYVLFNKSTLLFAVVRFTDIGTIDKTDFIYIGYLGTFGTRLDHSLNGIYKLDGITYPIKNDGLMLISGIEDVVVNFNFNDNKIEFPSLVYFFGATKGGSGTDVLKSISSQIDLSFSSNAISSLVYNNITNALSVQDFNTSTWTVNADEKLLATIFSAKSQVTADFEFVTNGYYDQVKQRLILPDKMYKAKGIDLSIYKYGLTPLRRGLDKFISSLVSSSSVDYIDNQLKIDVSENTTVNILLKSSEFEHDFFYGKEINIEYVDPSTRSGTLTYIALGDSLTNRGIASRVRTKIESESSLVVTLVGTMSNEDSALGEGREGWQYANFIGLNNDLNGSPILPLASGSTSTLLENPFLKLADAADKSNNPDWCFTNTGALVETSFTTNPALGDYYIFDWDFYFSNHSVTVPDVISIALSTNDRIKVPGEFLANSRLALQIMTEQLDQYCVDNAININTVLIPSPAWGSSTAGNNYYDDVVEWNELALKDINAASFTNITVDVLGMWLHQDVNFIFANSTNVGVPISADSTVDKFPFTEDIHWDTETGKRSYSDVLTACILNVLGYGAELITNGNFANGSTGWLLENGAVVNNSSVNIIGNGSRFSETILTVAKDYKLVYEVVHTNGETFRFQDGVAAYSSIIQTVGTHVFFFTAAGTKCQFQAMSVLSDTRIDNVSIREVL